MIDIINKCNLNCIHCYNRTSVDYSEMMSLEQIDLIISKSLPYGLERVYLTGGEPLLHPDLINILSYLARKYKSIEIGITTNGLLLTEKLLNEINSCGNIVIQISVDGVSKKTYEEIRGKNTYDSFISGFNLLRSSRALKKTARTCISTVNYKEVADIYKLCVEAQIEPSFIFVNKMGNATKQWKRLELNTAQKISVVDKINLLNKQYNYSISAPIPTYKCNFTQLLSKENGDYGAWGLSIRSDGRVSCCQYLYDFPIGNIFIDSIENMFQGNTFLSFVSIAKKRKEYHENVICASCSINQLCEYGCMGLSIENGNATSVDGFCEYRKMYAIFKACNYINKRKE